MNGLNCKNGEIYGEWTVIDNTIIVRRGHRYVTCRCKCGKIEVKCLSDLKKGRITSCRSCAARKRGRNVCIGQKYKGWTVIDGPKLSRHHNIKWKARCDCGNTRWIQANELTSPNKCFKCQKCAQVERGYNDTVKNGRVGDLTQSKYGHTRSSAIKRGIEFNVTIEYLWNLWVSQQNICAITGEYISSIKEASLDRIDSKIGYIPGNVQWTTIQSNKCKSILSMEELYDFCKKVLSHANQQPSTPLTKCEGSETNG